MSPKSWLLPSISFFRCSSKALSFELMLSLRVRTPRLMALHRRSRGQPWLAGLCGKAFYVLSCLPGPISFVVQADFELLTFLPSPAECWDFSVHDHA